MSRFVINNKFEALPQSMDKGRKKERRKNNLLLAKYMNAGYYVLVPLLLGIFFGLFVDRKLETKPKFTIIFLFFGVIATFYNLGKLVREDL